MSGPTHVHSNREEGSYDAPGTWADCPRCNPQQDADNLPEGPHSRACGWKAHAHGPDCHSNCPTCGIEL